MLSPVAPLPPDHTLVADTVKTKLPFRVKLGTVAPLAGDASNRRYFRLNLAGGPPPSEGDIPCRPGLLGFWPGLRRAAPDVGVRPLHRVWNRETRRKSAAGERSSRHPGRDAEDRRSDGGAAPRLHPPGLPQPQSHGAGRAPARPRLPGRPDGPLHLRPGVPAAGLLSVARPGPDRRTAHPLPGGTGQGERAARPRDVPATLRPDQHPAQPQGSRTVRLYRPGEAQRSLPPAHPTDPGLREAKSRTVPRPPPASKSARQICP